ncbi:MAG: recombinase family protein [Pseudooceanicola sp.]
MKTLRCAIYTRKSSEDGLEQEFNSLHAQRDACAAYVASQKHEGWRLLPDKYDDGGLSGGSLERPALQRLLEDVRDGRVDQIVVYKIDRLTRSLADFAKIVDILDAAGASFVSVTQSFNTATSMGRLTLNMLLSFAQFEREVTAERIRDKIAASKRKGLWMGGQVPMGYDPDGRTLRINGAEAETIRSLYDLYERLGTVRDVKQAADRQGLRTRRRRSKAGQVTGGGAFDRGHIHHILTNPIYAGRIRHQDRVHEGQHPAIIDPDRWGAIQAQLKEGAAKVRDKAAAGRRSLLCGRLFDETGNRLTPSHTRTRRGARLRYYVSHRLIARSGEAGLGGWRLPGEDLEDRIEGIVRKMLGATDLPARLLANADAGEVARLRGLLDGTLAGRPREEVLDLVERTDIAPGAMTVTLGAAAVATTLELDEQGIDPAALKVTEPFQHRKRGVETRLILADQPAGRDEVLIRNIALAHHWFGRIKAGDSFAHIAETAGVSKRRVQQMIGLAFLAPDIVRDVFDGKQPVGFTSDWCKTHTLPSDWDEQRRVLATL